MERFTAISKRYAAVTFVLITFAISYLLGLPFNLYLANRTKGSPELLATYAPILLVVLAPGLAALLMARLSWKVNPTSFLKASLFKLRGASSLLFLIPFLACLVGFTALALSGVPVAAILKIISGNWLLLLMHFAAQFFIVGIGEELGWRGWLLPQLLKSCSVGGATMLVFSVWTIWHIPKLFQSLSIILPFILLSFALSVISTWLWFRFKGDISLIAMTHAAVNAPLFFLENRIAPYGLRPETLLTTFQILAALYFSLAVFILLYDPKFWRKRINAVKADKSYIR